MYGNDLRPEPPCVGYEGIPRRRSVREGYEGNPRRQAARESPARTYARALPIVPVRARGLTVEGADGRRYLDCASGGGTLAPGHNHPVVLEAIRTVLDSDAPLHTPDLATPVRDAFVAELFRTLPPGFGDHARVQFCGPTATEAVEAEFRLVRAVTRRTDILALTDAHPGMTTSTLDVSGDDPDVRDGRLPSPQDHRRPYGNGPDKFEHGLDDPNSAMPNPAGVLLEPVQGGGVIPAPDDWMRHIRQVTATRSIPLIADETETGIGRTGAFWAVEHSGVAPDVMVLSNAISGSLPLAVVVHRDDLEVHQLDAPTDAFRANQLALAAGAAILAHVRKHDLAGRAAGIATRMLAQLRGMVDEFACVGDVRGRGLMIGVEFVTEEEGAARGVGDGRRGSDLGAMRRPVDGARPAAPGLAAAVEQECLRRGLIVELGGRHTRVARLLPPLTISDEQTTAALGRLSDAVEAVARGQTDVGSGRTGCRSEWAG
ncbi:aminotransferase class III-fold pyridoxal phosphate-dependent enzyme [Streptomyces sp. NPDC050528]|uniref:aminotransferase class III-fold pyridoxal phosphate-dependent enzyme n=1 Tax=Streptomyces sp. NPDC050528 TaxID=3365623 RepID=UPI00379599FB